ncbi:MAG: TolC family protein [Prevotellaceae bacterium]|nr:TolC family protein [Prevotellaceae bacterium]
MRKRIMGLCLLLTTALCASTDCRCQTRLSLPECLNYVLGNNLQLKAVQNEEAQAREAITENRAKLLPQLNGFASFDDNFKPPVSATDQSADGMPYYITHTLQYSAGMGIQLSLPLYGQTLYSSVSADTIGALQLWSEDFTFCSLCGMIGTCAAAPRLLQGGVHSPPPSDVSVGIWLVDYIGRKI